MKEHERGVDEGASGRAWANNPNFIRDECSNNNEQAVLLAPRALGRMHEDQRAVFRTLDTMTKASNAGKTKAAKT